MQVEAPTKSRESVIEPGGHTLQVLAVELVEYRPTAQAVHSLAPDAVAVAVFVMLPGVHVEHAGTSDRSEYVPALHSVQFTPPGMLPVLVIDPAAHGRQSVSKLPVVLAYVWGGQNVHAADAELMEYCPFAHAVQIVAPANAPASVRLPAAHTLHATAVALTEYLPALHALHS